MKTCNKCNTTKPLTEFYKKKDNNDGFENKCKECNYQTPETQDWFCPIDKSKLERNVLVNN